MFIFFSSLPNGVDTIHIELYDECAFTMDEKIAWAEYKIPSQIFTGETVEHWIPLDGKQGDGKEGTICLILSCIFIEIVSNVSSMNEIVGKC